MQNVRYAGCDGSPLMIILLPIRTVSVANLREHWATKARRAKQHRRAAWLGLLQLSPPEPPVRIRMIRIAPRKLDSDNLASAMKSIRDGVADWLGIDDGDERLLWEYAQQKGKPREYAVRIELHEWHEAAA